MEITTKQLRTAPGRIISLVNNGQEITITYRGKPSAKIVPITEKQNNNFKETENELFGIWKNRKDMENVEQYVRKIRKGRNSVN
ncbi:MAG: type II toxin-antitoxin system prevent-host-death family antitoxin [Leptospirales bacterium]|nr:type II toxin-antitoxin system prevent-host-death family antitoxin [Leptospirales bacterium]